MSAGAAVVVVPFLVLGVVAGLLAGAVLIGAVVGLLAGILSAAAFIVPAWRQAERRVVALLGATPADSTDHARLFNIVEGLCTAAGLPRPQIFVIDQEAPNAMTLGRDPRHGCLVVTEGLLGKLNRIELEGVVAHELSHLRVGDALPPTIALALYARNPAVARRVVAVVSDPVREAVADLAGVSLTRYPPGLISALEHLRADSEVVRDVPEATASLWLRPLDLQHDTVDARIGALREL